MTRGIDSNNQTASVAEVVRPVFFARLEYDSGFTHVHNSLGEIIWGSVSWQGVGDFGAIDGVQETNELQAAGITMTLSGINSDLLAIALGEDYHNRPAAIWLGF